MLWRNKISPYGLKLVEKTNVSMLYPAIHTLAKKLSGHIRLALNLRDDIVSAGPLANNAGSALPNKLFVTIVNIERETAGGIKFSHNAVSESHTNRTAPAWQLNLYVIISALFSEKQYEEGLQVLSAAVEYIQNNNKFFIDETSIMLAIEPVNLPMNELSNLWSICGGQYYPSMLFKIRTLNVGGDEIRKISRVISQKETGA